jgi:uncharacterized cofD-like protein
VRNCLVALGHDELLGALFQYRFGQGEGLAGHALGNLIIAALTDVTGDFDRALRVAGAWLGVEGSVVPSTLTDIALVAEDRDGTPISGQATIANNPVPIAEVRLEPAGPPAHPAAIAALEDADLVVIGPGSLFTSIIPNFLVAGIPEALRRCRGRRAYVCNVANQRGETMGMDAADHVDALLDHGLDGSVDVVVVHDPSCAEADGTCVGASQEALERIRRRGVEILTGEFADPDDPRHHDRERLVQALEEVL